MALPDVWGWNVHQPHQSTIVIFEYKESMNIETMFWQQQKVHWNHNIHNQPFNLHPDFWFEKSGSFLNSRKIRFWKPWKKAGWREILKGLREKSNYIFWTTLLLNEGIPRALKGKKLRLKIPRVLPSIFELLLVFKSEGRVQLEGNTCRI